MTQHDAFQTAYRGALGGYLLAGGEEQLHVAYELGRMAISEEISILELADVHHGALVSATAGGHDPDTMTRAITAAGDFLREALSGYEMMTRSFRDARDGTREERRHAAMLRRLSDLLADRSLELHASTSQKELALLLAEQARELCSANACLVTLRVASAGPEVCAAATEEGGSGWRRVLEQGETCRLPDIAPVDAKSLRLDGADLAMHEAFQRLAIACPLARSLRGWIVAPLTSLDGDRLGAIQIFSSADRAFGDVDEQVAVHLAQLASAALDRRVTRPGRGGPPQP